MVATFPAAWAPAPPWLGRARAPRVRTTARRRAWRGVSVSSPFAAELVTAAVLVSLCALGGFSFWRLYETHVLPHVPHVSTPAPPVSVLLDDRDAVKRLQRVKLLLGEANAYRVAYRSDWAEAALSAALVLDPTNEEALAVRAAWDASPIPRPTAEQQAALDRQIRALEILGATATLLDTDAPLTPTVIEAARANLDQALSLVPLHPVGLALLDRLPPR